MEKENYICMWNKTKEIFIEFKKLNKAHLLKVEKLDFERKLRDHIQSLRVTFFKLLKSVDPMVREAAQTVNNLRWLLLGSQLNLTTDFPNNTLDLHYLTVRESQKMVEININLQIKKRTTQFISPNERYTIVTGKGNHSQNGPRLKNAIENFLKDNYASFIRIEDQKNDGRIVLKVEKLDFERKLRDHIQSLRVTFFKLLKSVDPMVREAAQTVNNLRWLLLGSQLNLTTDFPNNTLDLHYLTVRESQKMVEININLQIKKRTTQFISPNERYTIVTGKGNHSQNGPRLKNAIENFLKDNYASFIRIEDQKNDGRIVLKVEKLDFERKLRDHIQSLRVTFFKLLKSVDPMVREAAQTVNNLRWLLLGSQLNLTTDSPNNTLDLHYLTVRESQKMVEININLQIKKRTTQFISPNERYTIVTGKGNHSQNGPRLKNAIENFLKDNYASFIRIEDQKNDGRIVVRFIT
ncbi:hypothetical protein TKK_0007337 [Trichogramma kaykai]